MKVEGTSKAAVWSSSNIKIAVVNSKGKVTGKKAGSATIRAKVGNKILRCKINVRILTVNKSELTITDNGSLIVTYKGNGTVEYSVEETDIISCNWEEGDWIDDTTELYIKGKKGGTAYITITNTYNNEKIIVKVVVEKDSNDDDLNNSDDYTTEENIYDILKKR